VRLLAEALTNAEAWLIGRVREAVGAATASVRRGVRRAPRPPRPSAAHAPLSALGSVVARYSGGFVRLSDESPLAPFILDPSMDDRLAEALAFASPSRRAPAPAAPAAPADAVAAPTAAADAAAAAAPTAAAASAPTSAARPPPSAPPPPRATYVERLAISDVFEARSAWRERPFRMGAAAARRGGALVRALLSPCELVEPTFAEVVLVWARAAKGGRGKGGRGGRGKGGGALTGGEAAGVEVAYYRNVALANCEALLPATRLTFRPADALRLDLVTFVSLV
jgi:hypothetical protein